jgi:hypothetical protein
MCKAPLWGAFLFLLIKAVIPFSALRLPSNIGHCIAHEVRKDLKNSLEIPFLPFSFEIQSTFK